MRKRKDSFYITDVRTNDDGTGQECFKKGRMSNAGAEKEMQRNLRGNIAEVTHRVKGLSQEDDPA